MASRLSSVATSVSQNGNQFAGGQAGSAQNDINLSSVPSMQSAAFQNPVGSNALANAIIGTTIAGSVVNAIEVWADGAVYDTTNNRFLIPYVHYDPTLRLRSGI